MSNYLTKDNKTDDLLPCANCGGEAEWRDGSSTPPYIRCKACGMRTYGSTVRGYRQKLAAVWNARAKTLTYSLGCRRVYHPNRSYASGPQYTCSACGYGASDDRWAYCPKCGCKYGNTKKEARSELD